MISSTIELCDFSRHFKTAVIDEAQLIADPDRGASWLKAICGVDADVVHVCMAPEALPYVVALVKGFGDEYTIREHKRLTPLTWGGLCRGTSDLREGDAVICFSRKNVLSTAAMLERSGFKASVIYGALPPQARRSEVRRFMEGESNIVVATDAIGMGINLPIRRVVFAETSKFDGRTTRRLNPAEVRQIAGRAGRYGLNEAGEVLSFGDDDYVRHCLTAPGKQVRGCCIPFPRETLGSGYPLDEMLRVWQNLPKSRLFLREDMSEALILLAQIKKSSRRADRELVYDLITCPVDIRRQELVIYWTRCAMAIIDRKHVPRPWFGTESLQDCELEYRAWDIHHQMLRRIGIEDDCTAEREEICEKIAEFMIESKDLYIRRCRVCGKALPIGEVFNICPRCHRLEQQIK